MAAITPDAAASEQVFATGFLGLSHRRFRFVDRTVNNADTWDSGIHGIRHVAWEASGPAHSVATTFIGAVVTFNCSTANRTGHLHVWSAG